MFSYVLRKLLVAIPLVVCIITAVFVLLEVSPGDITDKYFNDTTPPEVRELIREKFGLNKSAGERYLIMLGNVATFDFGRSLNQDRPVFDVIAEAFPNTLVLSLITLSVLFPVGIAVGALQAVRQNTVIDAGASVVTLALFSMPVFWVGLMLQLIFGLFWSDALQSMVAAEWISKGTAAALELPTLGMKDAVMYDFMSPTEQWIDRAKHLILPGIAMGVAGAASTARYMRSSLLGIIRQDFVRTARAKGLTERLVILKHGVRNALLPIVTLMGLTIPFLFSGSVLVEIVFSWPGMGRLIYNAILSQDTPLIIACFYVFTLVVVAGNLLADIASAWVDPRIRLGER